MTAACLNIREMTAAAARHVHLCSAVQQTDPLGTRDPPPVNTTVTQLWFEQPVLNLSSFLRGRGWLWWCMCLESKYLIGFKILSWVLVCVCVCVRWAAAWWRIILFLSRGGTSRSVSKLGNFYVYNLHVFTIYNVYNISTPRPAQRCSVGAPSRPWLHRPALAVCMETSWQAFNIPKSSFYTICID